MNTPIQDQAAKQRVLPNWLMLVKQLQQVVEEQFRQYDELLDKYDALLTGSEGLTDGWTLLEQSRLEFETHCQSVSDEIEKEYQQLADGWERLESQQRQLEAAALSGPVPLRSELGTAASTAPREPVSTAVPRPAAETSQKESHPAIPAMKLPPESPPQDLDIRDNWSPHLSGATALQFEQMKRQIQRHSSEIRRK